MSSWSFWDWLSALRDTSIMMIAFTSFVIALCFISTFLVVAIGTLSNHTCSSESCGSSHDSPDCPLVSDTNNESPE